MQQYATSWFSPSLGQDMPVSVYGHYGFALLLVPTASADYLEYERFGLIESIKPFIEEGKVKVFSVNSINDQSWMNQQVEPHQRSIRHDQWNDYVYRELVPFIKSKTSETAPIITCGASFGALHSMNLFLKRPDLISGVVAMSGVYELTEYTKGHFDDRVYFNSPMHYMPNLADDVLLGQIRESRHIHILSGSGPYEDPANAGRFARILYDKGITYELDIWGQEWRHDWPTWKAMLPHYLATRF